MTAHPTVKPPPIGASPGELRLWKKLNGELEQEKALADARQRSKALSRRSGDMTSALCAHTASLDVENVPIGPSVLGGRTATCGRRSGTGSSVVLSTVVGAKGQPLAQATSSELEAKLKSMTAAREAAQASAEVYASSNRDLQKRMAAAASADQAKLLELEARLMEVMAAWQAEQQEWAACKAALEAERDQVMKPFAAMQYLHFAISVCAVPAISTRISYWLSLVIICRHCGLRRGRFLRRTSHPRVQMLPVFQRASTRTQSPYPRGHNPRRWFSPRASWRL